MLRCEPAVFGPVASDPTVSRLIDTLAGSGERALQAIRSARAEVRNRVWLLAGNKAPDADRQVTVDLDGVLVIAHSDKEDAAATWKATGRTVMINLYAGSASAGVRGRAGGWRGRLSRGRSATTNCSANGWPTRSTATA
jgi:hypothetical protein